MPRGVLPATVAAGVAGAIAIPLDRPGVGWLLAALVCGAAIVVVDRGARRAAATTSLNPPPAVAPSGIEAEADAEIWKPGPARKDPKEPAAERLVDPSEPGTATSGPAGDDVGDPDATDMEECSRPAVSASGPGTETPEIDISPETRVWRQILAGIEATADQEGTEATADRAGTEATADRAGTEPNADQTSTEPNADESALESATAVPGTPRTEPEGADREAGTAEPVAPQPYRGRRWWAALTVALLSVGTWRASGWLFACCLAAATVTGSLALVGRRSAFGMWFDAFAVPWSALTVPPWLFRAASSRGGGTRGVRVGVSLAVTVVMLAVFVPLLAGADAVFASLLSAAVPDLDAASAAKGLAAFGIAAGVVAGALYLLAGPPPPATRQEGADRRGLRWRTAEWALPVGTLTVLFAVFVAVQLATLFGGDDYVQRTAGLTYAEHARQGFWQLSAVTILTLAVIAAVLRWAVQDRGTDRNRLRALLGAVAVLTLVIIASALYRMWTYQQAYGFTVLRLLVEVCELWIGLVYVLVLAGLIRLRRRWLPRAVIGTAAVTLLALAVVNPERLIADRNIDRRQAGKNIDTVYLSGLSADLAPAVARLPEPQRAPVLEAIRAHSDGSGWQSWNLAREGLR
ncbi:DUF4153 domain-containing protein [Nocardia sp. BMG51109]|uniref:DUF4153 domain-containing protein n=1 Tax=Nocardia sp. BMG51109 TaxID=1056816 RepID=UPI000467B52A|nr:DUF4153 domain-containing protein [Nocardia sp. BMG51109]